MSLELCPSLRGVEVGLELKNWAAILVCNSKLMTDHVDTDNIIYIFKDSFIT